MNNIRFFLRGNDGKEIELNERNNMLTWSHGTLGQNVKMDINEYSAIVIIVIDKDEQSIRLMCFSGEVVVDNEVVKNGQTIEIKDRSIIKFYNRSYTFIIDYDKNDVEKIVDEYMNDKFLYPIDLDSLFLKYANQQKITDKEAIKYVMAFIDVPEVEAFGEEERDMT